MECFFIFPSFYFSIYIYLFINYELWQYYELTVNKSFTVYEMLNDLNWNKYEPYISYNPNITWQIVLDNPSID